MNDLNNRKNMIEFEKFQKSRMVIANRVNKQFNKQLRGQEDSDLMQWVKQKQDSQKVDFHEKIGQEEKTFPKSNVKNSVISSTVWVAEPKIHSSVYTHIPSTLSVGKKDDTVVEETTKHIKKKTSSQVVLDGIMVGYETETNKREVKDYEELVFDGNNIVGSVKKVGWKLATQSNKI